MAKITFTQAKKHIVIMGFKHVGKSVIGKRLAEKIAWPFVDLDREIEEKYTNDNKQRLSCREIMHKHGEMFFRELEHKVLFEIIQRGTSVISLGGGAALSSSIQVLIKPHLLLHITSNKNIVFNRILQSGRPAFCQSEDNIIDTLNQLWDKRVSVFNHLSHCSILNNAPIEDVVDDIILRCLCLNN